MTAFFESHFRHCELVVTYITGQDFRCKCECTTVQQKGLEPVCSKKRPKKFKPKKWFGEYGTSEGSEWYQIGPKWAWATPLSFRINLVSFRITRGPLFSKAVSRLGLFLATSYIKPALVPFCCTVVRAYLQWKSWPVYIHYNQLHYSLNFQLLHRRTTVQQGETKCLGWSSIHRST